MYQAREVLLTSDDRTEKNALDSRCCIENSRSTGRHSKSKAVAESVDTAKSDQEREAI